MKCISCGNIIPDTSNQCPYCNNKVEPVAQAIPVYNEATEQTVNLENNIGSENVNTSPMQAAPVVPTTPTAPVLPQDQNLVAQPTETLDNETQNLSTQGVSNNVEVQPMVENVASTPTDPVVPANQTTPVAPISQEDVAMLDGTKIASGNQAPETKKKNSKLIIILVVVILLLALIGGGVFFYTSQYKSVNKRIDAIVNGLFSFTSSVKNDAVELASGTYSVDATINANEQEMTAKLNGKYAYDLENKLIDFTLNAEELSMGEELKLIPDGQPLSIELYTYESKAYVLLQNFYEKYISSDIEGYDELFSGLEQNDIDYQLIINSLKIALKSGLKAAKYTQTVDDVAISGKSQKANIIKMTLTKENQKAITTTLINNIMNNETLLKELAKLSDTTVEELKEELKTSLEEAEYEDKDTTIEVYTAMFGDKLIGAKISGKNDEGKTSLVEITPSDNGVKLICKNDGKEFLTLETTTTKKVTSTTKENSSNIDIIFYDDKEKAYKIKVNATVVEDINPKAEKVNIKNSVDYRYIPAEDQQKIINNISNYGTLGLLFKEYFGSMIEKPSVEAPVEQPITDDQTIY